MRMADFTGRSMPGVMAAAMVISSSMISSLIAAMAASSGWRGSRGAAQAKKGRSSAAASSRAKVFFKVRSCFMGRTSFHRMVTVLFICQAMAVQTPGRKGLLRQMSYLTHRGWSKRKVFCVLKNTPPGCFGWAARAAPGSGVPPPACRRCHSLPAPCGGLTFV